MLATPTFAPPALAGPADDDDGLTPEGAERWRPPAASLGAMPRQGRTIPSWTRVLDLERMFLDEPMLVAGIIALARSLNLMTVAEGVEERHQAQVLAAVGCSRAQGYLFARPLDPEVLVALPIRPAREGWATPVLDT